MRLVDIKRANGQWDRIKYEDILDLGVAYYLPSVSGCVKYISPATWKGSGIAVFYTFTEEEHANANGDLSKLSWDFDHIKHASEVQHVIKNQ